MDIYVCVVYVGTFARFLSRYSSALEHMCLKGLEKNYLLTLVETSDDEIKMTCSSAEYFEP